MTTTPQTNATLDQIAELIAASDDIVLCGHVSPDGDCLGSQLSLWNALRRLGKRATCLLVRDEPLAASVSFLPGIDHMVPAEGFDGHCGVFIGVDVPSRERIGAATEVLDRATTSVTIDHHACEATMCEHVYVNPDAASTSIIVWEVVKLLLDEPPLESAVCAYTGLVTDTGGFRYQNCDAHAFEAAADLIAHGVDPAYVSSNSFERRSLASIELEGLVIERLHLFADGRAAVSWISETDIERLGAVKADAEPLISTLRSIDGVRIACMLRGQDGKVRGSLRSKDATDVAALARKFGGGGHKAAAGFTLDMALDQARELVEGEVRALIGE